MFQLPLATSSTETTEQKFWRSILVYHNRPHLVNRRLFGASPVRLFEVDFRNESTKRLSEMFTHSAVLYEIRKLPNISNSSITKAFILNILEPYDKGVIVEDAATIEDFENSEGVYVSVRILLSRQRNVENCVEVVVLDKIHKVATFLIVTELDKKALGPPFPYDVEYTATGNIRICVQKIEDAETASAEWLIDQLFPKLLKWTEDDNTSIQHSLSLVPVDAYTDLYQKLKLKYGKNIVKMWTENTDPLKFVYEDIAIATYLIILWQIRHPNGVPSFMDLGCGNGLLVHILNSEGFPGFGIDIRKRKIWDHYPNTTNLKVQTITPSANFLFPNADWIIGNHSDELTPWIPIIAARSSYKTNFFLLPCCCYQFNGQKYMRKNTSVSAYADYLNYLSDLCKKCGFLVDLDKLRIPSTKRKCLISSGRTYTQEEFPNVDKRIMELLSECQSQEKEGSLWIDNFQARPNTERARNCTQLNRSLVTEIVTKVTQELLKEQNYVNKADGQSWNKGGTVLLPDLAETLGKKCLRQLKEECGGLKTLLRNHRYIFEVLHAAVRLRIPATFETTNGKYKEKPCWFYSNHPQGCYHDSNNCAYAHM